MLVEKLTTIDPENEAADLTCVEELANEAQNVNDLKRALNYEGHT